MKMSLDAEPGALVWNFVGHTRSPIAPARYHLVFYDRWNTVRAMCTLMVALHVRIAFLLFSERAADRTYGPLLLREPVEQDFYESLEHRCEKVKRIEFAFGRAICPIFRPRVPCRTMSVSPAVSACEMQITSFSMARVPFPETAERSVMERKLPISYVILR